MDELRILLAIVAFILGCVLGYDLFSAGFNLPVLAACVISFWVAHLFLPARSGRRTSLDFLEYIEFVVDLPYRTVAVALRALGSVVGKGPDNDI